MYDPGSPEQIVAVGNANERAISRCAGGSLPRLRRAVPCCAPVEGSPSFSGEGEMTSARETKFAGVLHHYPASPDQLGVGDLGTGSMRSLRRPRACSDAAFGVSNWRGVASNKTSNNSSNRNFSYCAMYCFCFIIY